MIELHKVTQKFRKSIGGRASEPVNRLKGKSYQFHEFDIKCKYISSIK